MPKKEQDTEYRKQIYGWLYDNGFEMNGKKQRELRRLLKPEREKVEVVEIVCRKCRKRFIEDHRPKKGKPVSVWRSL